MDTELDNADALVAIQGELITISLPHPTEDRFSMAWRIKVEHGGTLPAGVATLRLPRSEMEVSFDYRQSASLVAITVPFGFGTVGSDDEDDLIQSLMEQGGFGSIERSMLRVLFGDDTVRALHDGPRIDTFVRRRASWKQIGRVARTQASLRDRRIPVDGLWALEMAIELHEQGEFELQQWASTLAVSARPALQLMKPSWTEWLQPATVSRLQHVFVRAQRADFDELGPLEENLRARAENDLIGDMERIMAVEASLGSDGDDHDDGLDFDSEAMEFLTGGPSLFATRSRVRTPVLDSTRGAGEQWLHGRFLDEDTATALGLRNPQYLVRGQQLLVRLGFDGSVPAELTARLSIRATTDTGLLAASGAGFRIDESTETLLTAELLMPPGVQGSKLTVVVGADLPFGPLRMDDIDRERRLLKSRTDIERRCEGSSNVAEAAGATVAHLIGNDRVSSQTPMSAVLGDIPDDPVQLRGARSVALMMRANADAAEFEQRRRALQHRLDDLSIPELELLALAAARAGLKEVSVDLARASLELLSAGF